MGIFCGMASHEQLERLKCEPDDLIGNATASIVITAIVGHYRFSKDRAILYHPQAASM